MAFDKPARSADGRHEVWVPYPAPGHWECAEREDPGDDVVCGEPADDEPCPWHHPDPLVEAVDRALLHSGVWFIFGTNPVAKALGGPTEAVFRRMSGAR
jgi:hypothetical protein